MRQRRRSLALVGILLLFFAVAAAGGTAQMRSRQALEARFSERATLVAAYIRAYLEDLADEHVGEAGEWLTAEQPTASDVASFAEDIGVELAIVLDGHGQLLGAHPPRTDLDGIDLTGRYPHLAAATGGEVAVSGVIPATGTARKMVSIAVPFEHRGVRRIVASGWYPESSALDDFLRFSHPFGDAETAIVDQTGEVVLVSLGEDLPRNVGFPDGLSLPDTDGVFRPNIHGEAHVVAVASVEGTPWRVVTAAPHATVIAPVGGWRAVVPWLVLAALGAAVAASGWQLRLAALSEHRIRLRQDRANQVLRDAARAKDDFIAVASHEFRTPVTVIRGLSSLLTTRWDQMTDADRHRYVGVLDRNAVRLTALVEDLFVMSTLEARARRPAVSVPLAAALRDAVAVSRAGTSDVAILCPPDVTVMADHEALQRILVNLLDNAVKYGRAPIRVEVETTADGDAVEIAVVDHGRGVPSEFVPHLFDKFTQAETPETRTAQGSGLGLSIARALAEQQSGTITYRPNSPSGSRFVIRLDAAASAAAAVPTPA